jgi:hypothetical protein
MARVGETDAKNFLRKVTRERERKRERERESESEREREREGRSVHNHFLLYCCHWPPSDGAGRSVVRARRR